MRFIIASDWHFTMRPPEGRTSEYGDLILDKLKQVGDIVAETDAVAVLAPGDLWHRKGDVTQREVQMLGRAIKRIGVPVVTIPGNHDATPGLVPYRAYGTLAMAGVVQDVSSAGCWQPGRGKDRVVVTGTGYDINVDLDMREAYKSNIAGSFNIHLVHGYLMLQGKGPMEEYTTPEQCTPTAEVVVCGHYHSHQGTREHDGTLFVCPGSLARPSRAEMDNPVRVGLLEVRAGKATLQEWFDLAVVGKKRAFIAANKALSTVQDAREVAEGMYAGGGSAAEEIDRAIEQACAEFEYGAEVEGDAKARVHRARDEQEGGGDVELAGTARVVGGEGAESGSSKPARGRRKGGRRKASS